MKLYNTLSKQTEDLAPISAPVVTIYTCGPTVYDYPHIGNWFTFIRYDLLVRTLLLANYQPTWVMNITDVGHLVSDADDGEDKLEKGARREGKTAWDVAAYYGDYFIHGLERLNIKQPAYLPKATEHIDEQIALVQVLETKGYTYVIDDGVYFDTTKFPQYADFAQLDIDEQQAGKRVEVNSQKRNPNDFAVWKLSPKNEQRDMEWDSPWGKGFPGWHLECSAMSMKYLGETIDIHSGGIDHIPVHHSNEIAQSEAATGKRFSNYWMHTNHISVEGEKISKSLGNGITLEDVETKDYSLQAFRLHVLESHYRSQSKFSWDSLEGAQNRLARWHEMSDRRWQVTQPTDQLDLPQAPTELEASQTHAQAAHQALQAIETALLNDLDTPMALSHIDSLMSLVEKHSMTASILPHFTNLLQLIDATLGINLFGGDINSAQQAIITDRETARTAKDWATSDKLRDALLAQGIALRDTSRGPVWYRAT